MFTYGPQNQKIAGFMKNDLVQKLTLITWMIHNLF